MQHTINIRTYKPSDASALAHLYYDTIHKINIEDYTAEQVNVWAPKDSLELTGWIKKWEQLPPIVAECNGAIVGFAEFEDNGHIDCFYCHHEWIGKGVGRVMMAEVIDRAKRSGITRVFAEVSITAKPFFERVGFKVVKQQTIVRKGIELTNSVMQRFV